MMRRRGAITAELRREELQERTARFEAEQPRLAEAMRLVSMTLQQYEASLSALYGPRVTLSNATLGQGIYAGLDQSRPGG